MLVPFVEKLSSRLGRQLELHHLAGPQHRHPAKLLEVRPLIEGLRTSEAELVSLAATGSLGRAEADRRTMVIQLARQPKTSEAWTANLRFKGVYPEAEGRVVKRYEQGAGFVPVLVEPADGYNLVAKQERAEKDYSPAGTMSAARLRVEVETALTLGPTISDELLGFGLYDDLSFNGAPVGFVYYAMGRPEDNRLLDIVHLAWRSGFTTRFGPAARQAGSLLRAMHELGLAHQYPHLGNFTLDKQSGMVRLVDLDTAVQLASLPPETRLVWRYLDLSRTIIDFYSADLFGQSWDHFGKTMVDLLPSFFRGYFRSETNFPPGMPLSIKGETEESYNRSIYSSLYWQPRLIAEQNIGRPIDLRQYAAETPDFQPFWQALENATEGR